MQTLLIYVVALVLVGGLLFLAASFAFGRDEEMAPAPPDGTPVELPDDRPATGADLRALRLAVVLRGYRMEEVDWVLDRLAEQIDARDREIARLRSVLHVEPLQAAPPDGPGRPAAWSDRASWRPDGPADRPAAPEAGERPPAGAGPALAAEDERLTAPDAPVPMRRPADGPGAVRGPADGPGAVRAPVEGPGAVRAPVEGPGAVRAPADGPGAVRAPGDGAGPVPGRDRLAGPGSNPVRGLRPDGPPDRDQR